MRCYVKSCKSKAVAYCSRFNYCRSVGCASHLHVFCVGDTKEKKVLCSNCVALYQQYGVVVTRYIRNEQEQKQAP